MRQIIIRSIFLDQTAPNIIEDETFIDAKPYTYQTYAGSGNYTGQNKLYLITTKESKQCPSCKR